MPELIMVIRHAEKPGPLGRPAGIERDGREDRHSLIVRGWQRAGALAPFFCAPWHAQLRPPGRLYAPPPHGQGGDHGRPHQTLTAVAERLGLPIDTGHELDQEPALVADLLVQDGTVLVAWEHKRIPVIANAILGDTTTAPQSWPDERFDLVWLFEPRPDGGYRFAQLPQLLLGGDRADIVRGG